MKTKIKYIIAVFIGLLILSCSKDDDAQPQTETPTPPPVAEADKAPVISAQTFTAKEDIKDDVVIGNIVATDPESKALTFVLIQNSNDLFELTATGELSLATDKKLDYETTTSYTLTVEVSDGKNKVNAEITITVENVAEPFITTWKTITANENITFQLDNTRTDYDYTIDWGDGTVETNQTTTKNHRYTTAGVYTISVSGKFPAIKIDDIRGADRLQTIEQWGDNEWESMEYAFSGCESMTYKATDIPNLSKVTNMNAMFSGCKTFNADLNNWDVSNVVNMQGVFSGASSFNGNISEWNVSNVASMRRMFALAASFNGDISKWDVSKVEDMSGMFQKAFLFNGDLSNWNVSKVVNMESMFREATAFNGDLSTWSVSKVTNMAFMFERATSYSKDISSWDVQGVANMYNMLNYTKISEADYDKLLTKWAALPNLQSNVSFGAQGLTFCNATSARSILVNDKGWTITGDIDCHR